MSSIKWFDLSSQVHTQDAGPFWLQFLSSDREGVTFSCLFLNKNHELRSHSRQIDLCRQGLHSRDLLPCWLRRKVAGMAC